MMKILPVSLRSRWSCCSLCLAVALAAGCSSGGFDGEKAPYGPKTPTTQIHSTLTISTSLSTSTSISQVTTVVGQKAIGGVTYDRLATTRVEDPSKGGEYWIKDNSDGTVAFAGFAHSSLGGGLIPAASMTLNTPITVKLDSPVGVAQPVTASGKLTLTDTLATTSADVTGHYTLVEKDATVATGVGPVSGCSHYSGQASTNSEGVPAAFRVLPISGELWYHPSYGVVAFNSPEIGIGTAMSDSSDCGSVDSSNYRIIRKVGVVDSSSSFKLDTYDCDGNQIAADKNTHAKMLLELRWADETMAKTDTQPGPIVEFGTTLGYFPNRLAESPTSIFHPEENGKGFKYWYSYVSQAAKNEPGDNSTTYHISVRAVTGLSPVRVTGRIYYKVLPDRVGATPDAGPIYTGGADSGLASRADGGVASQPDSPLASDARDSGGTTDSRADAGTPDSRADAGITYFTVSTPPLGITAPAGATVSALTATKDFVVGGIFWKDGRLFSASGSGGPIVSVMPGETGSLWADDPSLAGGTPSWRHGVPLTGGNILLAIDYYGGPTGLHEITPTGIDTPWTLASGHSGIGDIVALPSGGWVFSDFESYSIFKVPAKNSPETSLIPAGSGSYSPAYLAYDGLTDTLYFVNMINQAGESYFGGDGAIYKLTGTATTGTPVLVAKAPTGARFNGLAVGLGGLFPAGLYASDTFNSQVVRVESTGTLTPVITGVPTLGELRIDPVSKGLALRSADAALLFFLGTGTGGGPDAGAKDAGVVADARPDATAAVADGGADAAVQDAGGGCGVPAAGGVCTTFPACGCPAGQACNPSSTHLLACFPSNNLADGADCSSGSTCQAGSGCFDGVCRPYCGTDTDCPLVAGLQSCMPTYWDANQTMSIPGVKVCARICDPAHPQAPRTPFLSCPVGFSCSSSPTGASFCFKATPLPAGSACTADADCPAGNSCTGTSATTLVCKQYCLSNSDCAAGTTCQFAWSPPQYAGTSPVGYCQ